MPLRSQRATWLALLDNAPHYGTALDSGTNARNTSFPRWASWIVLGQNFHGIYHGSPGLRWHDPSPYGQAFSVAI